VGEKQGRGEGGKTTVDSARGTPYRLEQTLPISNRVNEMEHVTTEELPGENREGVRRSHVGVLSTGLDWGRKNGELQKTALSVGRGKEGTSGNKVPRPYAERSCDKRGRSREKEGRGNCLNTPLKGGANNA